MAIGARDRSRDAARTGGRQGCGTGAAPADVRYRTGASRRHGRRCHRPDCHGSAGRRFRSVRRRAQAGNRALLQRPTPDKHPGARRYQLQHGRRAAQVRRGGYRVTRRRARSRQSLGRRRVQPSAAQDRAMDRADERSDREASPRSAGRRDRSVLRGGAGDSGARVEPDAQASGDSRDRRQRFDGEEYSGSRLPGGARRAPASKWCL